MGIRPDPAAGPDPAAADLPAALAASKPRSRSASPSTAAPAAPRRASPPRLRRIVQPIPDPGDEGDGLVLRAGRDAARQAPRGTARRRFTWDAHALPLQDFSGAPLGAAASGRRPRLPLGTEPARLGGLLRDRPLTANTTVIGAGAVNVWVRSSTPNVDLQATVSEVRPDGKETFVQNGWLRADERKLDAAKSTPLEPVLSLRESDVEPMPAKRIRQGDDPALLRGPRLPHRLPHPGHDLRAERHPADLGLRRGLTVSRPGRDRLLETQDPPDLLLPVVPGVKVPTAPAARAPASAASPAAATSPSPTGRPGPDDAC